MERIVLAYSGGLATSVAIPWLADTYGAEVITVTMDLGQGRELALSLPLIAEKLVQIAGIEKTSIVAHGSTNDAIDVSARALNGAVRVVAPAREWHMDGAGVLDYAHARNLPLPPDPETYHAVAGQPEPAMVDVAFDRGLPTGINGVTMSMLDLLESLGTLAAAHGVGRSRGRDLRDAPAAIVLFIAHEALLTAVSSDEQRRHAAGHSREFADMVVSGRWFSPAREALDRSVNAANERVTGIVRVKLFNGGCEIVEARPSAVVPGHTLTVVKVS